MQAVLALVAINLLLVGRILTYRSSRSAWLKDGPGTAMDKLNADPKLKLHYRLGLANYSLGVVLFIVCFFL
jgi:hypothetical protein